MKHYTQLQHLYDTLRLVTNVYEAEKTYQNANNLPPPTDPHLLTCFSLMRTAASFVRRMPSIEVQMEVASMTVTMIVPMAMPSMGM